jgi:HSP20 family molecular chaperone IbpA
MPDYVDLDNSVAELKDGMLSLTFDLTKLKEQPPQNNIKKIKITKD